MTCTELLDIARKGRPTVRYARHRNDSAVAAFQDGRWIMVASKTIDGKWCSMPYEVLVNGKPCHQPEDWLE